MARKLQTDKILNDAGVKLAVLESSLEQKDSQETKAQLLQVMNTLIAKDPQIDQLRAKCLQLLETVQRKENTENALKEAIKNAENAIKNKDFVAARDTIALLHKDLQKHSPIKALLRTLSRSETIEDALQKARQAYDDGDYDIAWEQIRPIKKRDNKNQEIKILHCQIESAFKYNSGLSALEAGSIDKAKRDFKQVIKLDCEHCEDAREQLRRIDEEKENNRKARKTLKDAQKYFDKKQYQKAYQALDDFDDIPPSLKKEVAKLQSSVRDKWRRELLALVKAQLKEQHYDSAFQSAALLKEIMQANDSKLLNQVQKNYHIHHAQLSEKKQLWAQAHDHWEEAQKFDLEDPRIAKGLQVSRKQQNLAAAAQMDNQQAIATLEEVLERRTTPLTDLDYSIEEQLYRLYIQNQAFDRAIHLAVTRLKKEPRFAAKAAAARESCLKLIDSGEKFRGGSYRESLEILKDCRDQFQEYSDIIQELYGKRKNKIIETLLNEAMQLEIDEIGDVHILGKYKEVLQLEPEHRKAREKHSQLLDKFKRSINETTQKALELEENENADPLEMEELICRIEQMLLIASPDQKAKLQPRLDNLDDKMHHVQNLNRKLKHIRGFINDAKVTGDFSTIDIELNDDTIKKSSERNRKLRQLVREIKNLRERRKKCEDIVKKMETTFHENDFLNIESFVNQLIRLDEDDEFYLQQDIKLEDDFSDEIIAFAQLKDWAKSRQSNLDSLTAWFNTNRLDTSPFEEEEKKFRENATQTPGSAAWKPSPRTC